MSWKRDWLGKRFGKLVVLEVLPDRKARCICDCGNETVVYRNNLSRPNTRSCGCIWMEEVAHGTKHGKASTTEYKSWSMMKNRCLNPNAENKTFYAGRGITICERWLDFQNFIDDMGLKPTSEHSLERIDNGGNYEPGNCCWATRKRQCRNKRSNRMMTHNGETMCAADWAEKIGMRKKTLLNRLSKGWSDHRALTAPVKRIS